MKLVSENVEALTPKDKEIRQEIVDNILEAVNELQDDEHLITCIQKDGQLFAYSTLDVVNTHALYCVLTNVMLEDVINDL